MEEEIQMQSAEEVKNIDYMKATNEAINVQIEEQMDNINALSDTLDDINNTVNFIAETTAPTTIDVSEIVDSIDTTIVEAQTQDILTLIDNQQRQIDNIESTVNEINEKLNELIDKT